MKKTTSERLNEIMCKQNLKQVDILENAKKYCEKYNIKLTKSDLSQFVSGKVEPGQAKLFILGLTLNVSEAWLMGYDVPPERTTASKTINETAPRTSTATYLAPLEQELINDFRKLTDYGKKAAVERVKEMTELSAYALKSGEKKA